MKATAKRFLLLVLVSGSSAFDGEAGAQTLYRCGNKYQDRPCDAGQQGKAVGNSASPGAAAGQASSGAADADCSRRGRASMKVVWGWEGGASAERQLEEINRNSSIGEEQKAQDRKLVADVYRQRGTANQVSARIEAECIAEKEEKARTKALADALIKSGVKPPSSPASGDSAAPANSAQTGMSSADREAEARKSRCRNLNAQQQSIREQQRAGGSAATMDQLNRSYQNVTRSAAEAGC